MPSDCAPSKVITLRRGLLVAFVVGLGSASPLARAALWLLMLRWLWRLRDVEVRRGQRWPLWEPVLALVGATILSALVSDHAAASLVAAKTLLVLGALYVAVDALEDAHEGDGFLSWLALAAGAAALVGLVQYSACPPHEPAAGLGRLVLPPCHRARAFYSIYMTLAGVLTIALLVTLPRVLPGGMSQRGQERPAAHRTVDEQTGLVLTR